MKKLKLFATISSLCLAVAVLCFGVFSAVNVTYTINGSISYEVEDVFVNIETRVFKVAQKQTEEQMQTAISTLSTKALDSIKSTTYIESQTFTPYNTYTNTGTPSASGINIVYGTKSGETTAYYTYYIVINIQNLSPSKDISAYIKDNTTASNINSNKATNTYQNNIKSTETRNIVIAYSIDDLTNATSVSFSYTLTVDYKGYEDEYSNLLQTDGSMWYINYGTYNNNPIMWKYVGTMNADGTNMQKYTYSSTKPTGLAGKAVFVQSSLSEDSGVDSGGNLNYYNCTIRSTIKDGSYFNLSAEEQALKLAQTRIIENVESVDSNNNFENTYTLENDATDKTGDKFWLMSLQEARTFEISSFENSKDWWIRTSARGSSSYPNEFIYFSNSSNSFVVTGGVIKLNSLINNAASLGYTCNIRAAFILSADVSM